MPTDLIEKARAELAALQEEADRRAEARKDELALREVKAQVAAAKRQAAIDAAIIEYEVQYGPQHEAFGILDTPAGWCAIGRPEAAVFRSYIDDPRKDAVFLEAFVRQCILPRTAEARDAFGKIVSELPGALWAAENLATALARRGIEVVQKK